MSNRFLIHASAACPSAPLVKGGALRELHPLSPIAPRAHMFACSPEGGRFRVPTLLDRQWSPTSGVHGSARPCRADRSSGRSQAHTPARPLQRLRSPRGRPRSARRAPCHGRRREVGDPWRLSMGCSACPLVRSMGVGHAPRIARLHDPHPPPISRAQAPRIRLLGRTGADAPVLDRGSRGTGEIVSARVCQTCGRVLNAEHRLDRAQVAAEFGLGRAEVDRVFADLPVTAVSGRLRVRVRRADVERYLDEHTYRPGQIRRSWDAG